jgi:hypothetical protein
LEEPLLALLLALRSIGPLYERGSEYIVSHSQS